MSRLLFSAAVLSTLAFSGCKTSDGEANSDTKDVVTQNGLVTKHYYAVGEEARRAICPFGIDSEDAETYRAQCQVSKTMPLGEFTESLEKAYMQKFKGGQPLTDEENQIGGLIVQSLADATVLKVKAGQQGSDQSDVIAGRFAQVFDEAFGFPGGGGSDDSGGGGNNGDGGNEGGNGGGDANSLILTASFVAPLGIAVTPLIVAQNPVVTNKVTVQLAGCQGQILGMTIAEGQGQPLLTMGTTGPGQFQTISGNSRKFAMVQLTINAGGGFCQVKITSAGTSGGGGGGGGGNTDPGQLGPEAQIGVIQYNGGFIPQLVAPLNPARVVKQFRVAVPQGCQADVVKGGILTTQQVAPTVLIDAATHTYRVNNGAGTLAAGVSVSLNGPLGFCQIPIFVR